MLRLIFSPRFTRNFKRLSNELQEEAFEKIALFKNIENHAALKVHKLHGQLKGSYSFSVNYKTRIVFDYISKTDVALLSIGDHEVYD
jgi:mRNA-degrading endonuclease YafQ of YafQ-DinJ toxin-antitoxin module